MWLPEGDVGGCDVDSFMSLSGAAATVVTLTFVSFLFFDSGARESSFPSVLLVELLVTVELEVVLVSLGGGAETVGLMEAAGGRLSPEK